MYYWNKNKGYGTPEHKSAIETHGLCRYHRKSFNIYRPQEQEALEYMGD
jgi:ribonuclease HII